MVTLQKLRDEKIEKAEKIHDYFQIFFSNGYILSVYNAYQYSGSDLSSLNNCKVDTIVENNDSIAFHFNNGEHLTVGLRDKDYFGPEAMLLSKIGEDSIVWN